jgi:hypothetical protein
MWKKMVVGRSILRGMRRISIIGICGNSMERRGIRMRRLVCSWWDDGRFDVSWCGCAQLTGDRYEDERVIQALEIIQDETGLPFVNYV